MGMTLGEVEALRRKAKAELMCIHARLSLGMQGLHPAQWAVIRAGLIAKQAELNITLSELKEQSRGIRAEAEANGTGIIPGDIQSALEAAYNWLLRLKNDGVIASEEAERRTLNTIQHALNHGSKPTLAEVGAVQIDVAGFVKDEVFAHRERADVAERRLAVAEERIKALESSVASFDVRLAAGAERRKEMIYTLAALLSCEDDEAMSEEAYEKRMDAVVRRARTLVSAEKAAILREREVGE